MGAFSFSKYFLNNPLLAKTNAFIGILPMAGEQTPLKKFLAPPS
jgi:hypothetical protein